jgi:hypothetical protein
MKIKEVCVFKLVCLGGVPRNKFMLVLNVSVIHVIGTASDLLVMKGNWWSSN